MIVWCYITDIVWCYITDIVWCYITDIVWCYITDIVWCYITDIRLEVSVPLFRGCSWSNGLQQIVVVDHTYSYTRAIIGYLDRQEIW